MLLIKLISYVQPFSALCFEGKIHNITAAVVKGATNMVPIGMKP